MTHSVNSSNNEVCEQPITVKESKEPQQHELIIEIKSTNEQLKVRKSNAERVCQHSGSRVTNSYSTNIWID